jgi:hypothetical protein
MIASYPSSHEFGYELAGFLVLIVIAAIAMWWQNRSD